MTSEMRPGLKTASVLGTLPGAADEDITILAHMDGYFQAALDNGSGLAVHDGPARALREGAAGRSAAATSASSAPPDITAVPGRAGSTTT